MQLFFKLLIHLATKSSPTKATQNRGATITKQVLLPEGGVDGPPKGGGSTFVSGGSTPYGVAG